MRVVLFAFCIEILDTCGDHVVGSTICIRLQMCIFAIYCLATTYLEYKPVKAKTNMLLDQSFLQSSAKKKIGRILAVSKTSSI